VVSLTIKEVSLYRLLLNPALYIRASACRWNTRSRNTEHWRSLWKTWSHSISLYASFPVFCTPVSQDKKHYMLKKTLQFKQDQISTRFQFFSLYIKSVWFVVFFFKDIVFVCRSLFLFQLGVGLDLIQWDFIGAWKWAFHIRMVPDLNVSLQRIQTQIFWGGFFFWLGHEGWRSNSPFRAFQPNLSLLAITALIFFFTLILITLNLFKVRLQHTETIVNSFLDGASVTSAKNKSLFRGQTSPGYLHVVVVVFFFFF